jgi:hypothetical protein
MTPALAAVLLAACSVSVVPAPTPGPTGSTATVAPASTATPAPPFARPIPADTSTPAPSEAPSASEPPSRTSPPVPTPTAAPTEVATESPPGSAVDPTTAQVLLDSLLDPRSVDSTATSTGPKVETATDVAAFADNGGLRVGSQTISFGDNTVFDIRYQFPDAASAGAFLDAAEPELSETSNGLASATPPVTIGDDTRYYAGEIHVGSVTTENFNYLGRAGNLAVKLFVAGPSDEITEDYAAIIAGLADGQISAALGTTAEGSPEPGETGSPSPTETAAESPAASLDAVLAHVPESVRGSCQESSPDHPESGLLVEVTCEPAAANMTVKYDLYDSKRAMDDAYDTLHAGADALGADYSKHSCRKGSYDGTYTIDKKPAGRLTCYDELGSSLVIWTHTPTSILSIINNQDGDVTAAYQLWLDAGPE